MGARVAEIAFAAGIKEVSVQPGTSLSADGSQKAKDYVDVQTSTPKSKRFLDGLLAADFYDQDEFSIAVRQPRALVSGENIRELTKPLVEPAADIFEELWQFSHITTGFVGRIFIAGCMLAYGLIHQKTLLIIAGLLFLPILPTLLAIGFGGWTRQWKLAGQGLLAFLAATALLVLSGAAVGAASSPPIKYDDFNTLAVGLIISAGVGVAAVLANIDDVGRRELIGLAATAQIAIVPVWFGICAVLGFPSTTPESEISSRALSFPLNVLTIIVTSLIVYVIYKAASGALARVKS